MERVRQFAENTTIHGLKDFLRIDYVWARCLWAAFVLSCFGMMIFEMYQLLKEYIDDPTATQVRQKYLAQYPYPKMIFCPKEWINETRVAELDVPKSVLVYGLSMLKRIRLDRAEVIEYSRDTARLGMEFDEFLRTRNITNYLDFYYRIADDPRVVSKCEPCDTHVNQILASGVCIQWRATPATSDLLIQLPPRFQYTEMAPKNYTATQIPKYIGSFAADAMYVSFRPQYDFFAIDPILVNRNNSYVLRIKPTNYIRLNKPPARPCASEAKVRNDNYSQLMCYFRCDERFKAKCQGCKYLNLERNKYVMGNTGGNRSASADGQSQQPPVSRRVLDNVTLPYCTSLQFDPVVAASNRTSCSDGDDREFTECARGCEPLCNEWVYETTVIPVAKRNLITANTGADITCVLSYQVRFGETFIEEVQTYSYETFISNIGGQLGLWMGASVVSLLQVFHFVAEFCFYEISCCSWLCRRYRQRRQRAIEKTAAAAAASKTTEKNGNTIHSGLASGVYAVQSLGAQNWIFRSAFDVENGKEKTVLGDVETTRKNGHLETEWKSNKYNGFEGWMGNGADEAQLY